MGFVSSLVTFARITTFAVGRAAGSRRMHEHANVLAAARKPPKSSGLKTGDTKATDGHRGWPRTTRSVDVSPDGASLAVRVPHLG